VLGEPDQDLEKTFHSALPCNQIENLASTSIDHYFIPLKVRASVITHWFELILQIKLGHKLAKICSV
jgi:hypothetical protein